MACGKKFMTTQQRPLLLKDYLIDDLSSCSSNGFKSFPRRHCCSTTTVRLLLDIDLKSSAQSQPSIPNSNKTNRQNSPLPLLRRSRSRAAAACDAVINAVKSLPFHSVKYSAAPSVRKRGMLLLPRSLSRRLRRKSFWKKQSKEEKQEKDIGRWRSFREFLEEQPPPADQASTTITVSRLSASTRSSESKSGRNSKNNSWGESEFTSSSDSSSTNDVVVDKTTSLVKNKVSEEVGAEVGEDSVSCEGPTTAASSPQNANSKGWLNVKDVKDEKEQLSPVSVLDCPFEDEDDQTSSPFSCSLARMQGTQEKLMHKIRRFESLAQLEPMDLEQRINTMMSDSEVEDEDPTSFYQAEEKAGELVKLIKASGASSSNRLVTMKAENLVLDMCRERIVENKDENVVMQEVMKVAGDWINGQSEEMLLGWEVEGGRKVYVNDMDKYCVGWRDVDQEKQEVGLELEVEVWNSLLKELLLDLVI